MWRHTTPHLSRVWYVGFYCTAKSTTANDVAENFSFSSSRILGRNANVLWHTGSSDAAPNSIHTKPVWLSWMKCFIQMYISVIWVWKGQNPFFFFTFEVKDLENYLKNNLFSTQDHEFCVIYYPYSVFIFFPKCFTKDIWGKKFLMGNIEAQVQETLLLCRVQITWGWCCLLSPLKFLSIADHFNDEVKHLLGNSVDPPGYLPEPTKSQKEVTNRGTAAWEKVGESSYRVFPLRNYFHIFISNVSHPLSYFSMVQPLF